MAHELVDAERSTGDQSFDGPVASFVDGVSKSVGRQFDAEPGGGLADQIADAPGLQDNLDDGQDDFVVTGLPKTIVDTVFDYEPIQNPDGETVYRDEEDLMGPSVDADPSEGLSVIDWRSEISQEEDPTSPQNSWLVRWLMNNPEKAILGIIALYVLSALGPLLEMGANLTEA